MAEGAIKLNLGCGAKILPKPYINVDLPNNWADSKPDVEADLTKPLPFPDDYADEVMAIHVIEHFDRWEAPVILRDWVRVLKPGAIFMTYEWVTTPKFDPANTAHVACVDEIIIGNGLPVGGCWQAEGGGPGRQAGCCCSRAGGGVTRMVPHRARAHSSVATVSVQTQGALAPPCRVRRAGHAQLEAGGGGGQGGGLPPAGEPRCGAGLAQGGAALVRRRRRPAWPLPTLHAAGVTQGFAASAAMQWLSPNLYGFGACIFASCPWREPSGQPCAKALPVALCISPEHRIPASCSRPPARCPTPAGPPPSAQVHAAGRQRAGVPLDRRGQRRDCQCNGVPAHRAARHGRCAQDAVRHWR